MFTIALLILDPKENGREIKINSLTKVVSALEKLETDTCPGYSSMTTWGPTNQPSRLTDGKEKEHEAVITGFHSMT